MKLTSIDKYGVLNYSPMAILGGFVLIVSALAIFMGNLLFIFESPVENANIKSVDDAIWVIWMSMSTIGFGDKFPVTLGGRIVTGLMFPVGAIVMGVIIGTVAKAVTSLFDNSIENRALKKQADTILHKLDRLETFIGVEQETKFGPDAHGIDHVIEQYSISLENDPKMSIITLGKDDSGRYVVAVNTMEGNVNELEWYTFDEEKEARVFYKKPYIK